MSKARAATDQVVKLIVGAGQASPSPPVGPALGSKGVKSMDFCRVCAYLLLFLSFISPNWDQGEDIWEWEFYTRLRQTLKEDWLACTGYSISL